MVPGLDLRYTDPAQHIATAGWDIDVLDNDLSKLLGNSMGYFFAVFYKYRQVVEIETANRKIRKQLVGRLS